MAYLTGLIKNLQERVRPVLEEKKIIKEEESSLQEEIERARRKWQQARHYFENVSEPELVDHATYLIQATRTKYMYLLNKAREE